MKLEILISENTLEELILKIEKYFQCNIRIFRSELSIFEQYEIRPNERKFIPKIWSYRIIAKNNQYHFGII